MGGEKHEKLLDSGLFLYGKSAEETHWEEGQSQPGVDWMVQKQTDKRQSNFLFLKPTLLKVIRIPRKKKRFNGLVDYITLLKPNRDMQKGLN